MQATISSAFWLANEGRIRCEKLSKTSAEME